MLLVRHYFVIIQKAKISNDKFIIITITFVCFYCYFIFTPYYCD